MSGRRAKQRRRLVWKAASGDAAAFAMTSDLTPKQADRITARHIATEARRAGRRKESAPVRWNPAAADKDRAEEHRHRERGGGGLKFRSPWDVGGGRYRRTR